MMREFIVPPIDVSAGKAALVVPEIGINHGGSISVALALADCAIDAGAKVIKHQTHIPSEEMSIEALTVTPGNDPRSIFEVISDSTLSEEEEWRLCCHIRSRGAEFFSTPFSLSAVDRLEAFKVPLYKIGSGECSNVMLLEKVAATGKPVILSTGMHSDSEIEKAVGILRQGAPTVAILHTTNVYPAPPEILRLRKIVELRARYPAQVVGFSDHSPTLEAAFAAVSLGAQIVEKHFTDSRRRSGPDIKASMNSSELRHLLSVVEFLHTALDPDSPTSEGERVTRRFATSSLVSKRPIEAGETLSQLNCELRRPSGGEYSPENYLTAFGRRAALQIRENTQIQSAWLVE